MADTYRRRPPIVGPVILIGIGVLALLQNFDYLPANFWQTIWRLWPAILVLIGVEIIIGQMRLPWALSFLLALAVIVASIGGVVYLAQQGTEGIEVGGGEMTHIETDLQGVTSATVRLSFGAGALRVGSTSTNNIMVGDFGQARGQTQARVNYTGTGGRGDLRIDVPEEQFAPMFTGGRGNEWNVKLNSTIPLSLGIDAGASTNDLDLTDLKLSDLRVSAGVSTNTIRLPRTGNYTAHITGGLATTTITVPEGVAARITVEGGLSTISVDESRFHKSGDVYVSPDYDTATNKVSLAIEGGLATISVR
jgi:hypothetical protein